MTIYEMIDIICDSVNPLLLVFSLSVGIRSAIKGQYTRALIGVSFLFCGLALVYGTLFLDNQIGIWAQFEGDYSTHTAFAIATSIAISTVKGWEKRLLVLFALYATMMLYQQYHSLLDIASTTLVIGAPLIAARWFAMRHRRVHSGSPTFV